MNGKEISRVVVIDDDEGTVEIIAAFLSEIPSICSRVFTSPSALLSDLSAVPPGEFPRLIFSDIIMPEYNGLQLIDRVENICQLRHIPKPLVIFISGNIEERNRSDDLLRRIHERGYQTLSKPFRMETILQVTERALTG